MESTAINTNTAATQRESSQARPARRSATDNEIEELVIRIRQECKTAYARFIMYRNVLNGNSYNLRSGALRTQIAETLQGRHLLSEIGDFDRALSLLQRKCVNSGDLDQLREKNRIEEQCLALTQKLQDLTLEIALLADLDADRMLDTKLARRFKEEKDRQKAAKAPKAEDKPFVTA